MEGLLERVSSTQVAQDIPGRSESQSGGGVEEGEAAEAGMSS